MTREAFIRKWLANKDFQYCEEGRAQMREDLDKVIEHAQPIASVSGKRPATVHLVWRTYPTRLLLGCFDNEDAAWRYLGATQGFVQSIPVECSPADVSAISEYLLEWVNINDKLPPEHALVLTIDSSGYLSLSRYVSNDFPSGQVFWAQTPLPKDILASCASGAVDTGAEDFKQFLCTHCGTNEKEWCRKNDDWYCKNCGHIVR